MTIELSGTLKLRKAPEASITLFPTCVPTMNEFVSIITLSPIVGTPMYFPKENPMLHPRLILKILPILAFGTAPPNVPGLNGVNKISEVFFWNTSKVTFNGFFKKEGW